MELIGHRGAKGLVDENTVASLQKALECGVDMIEVDIRVHDNQLVLSHNPTLNSEKYCSLSDALDAVNGLVPLILEIKEADVVNEQLRSLVQTYSGKVIFSSKKFTNLYELRKLLPEAEVAITEKWSGIRAVAEAGLLHTNQLHLQHTWLWSSFVRSMKHQGFDVYAYTVNSLERAQELAEWGVKGVFTDFPDRLQSLRK